MAVIIDRVPYARICGECFFLRPKAPYPCWCYAGDFAVKPSETDLKDGICPMRRYEANEVRRGRYYYSDDDFCWHCDACQCAYEGHYRKPVYKYCPNCGACMVEEADDE